MMLPMSWLWIILRCLFPGDPIRQGAEAIRHRVIQLVDTVNSDNWLPQLQADPAFRLYLEFLILDAEDCLRLWITMRGCQIAGVRCRTPWERSDPHLVHAKDLPELFSRIRALAAMCERMEELAQAYARRLTRLREADPLAIRTACGPHRHASHATSLGFAGGGQRLSSLADLSAEARRAQAEGGGGGAMRSIVTEGAGREAAGSPHMRGPPHSIAATHPQPASQASPARTRTRAQSTARRPTPAARRPARACPIAPRTSRASRVTRATHAIRASPIWKGQADLTKPSARNPLPGAS
jgi:hypothetical protein